VFLPFSERAKRWEPIAIQLRQLVSIPNTAQLDPSALAKKVGLTVIDDQSAFDCLPEADRLHLLGDGCRDWSGGVYPEPLPNGTCLCILNPRHSRRRRKITLMEEIVHKFLGHTPSDLMLSAGHLQIRDYDKQQEEEAYGIGAAALLPWSVFFKALNAGKTIEELAEHNDLTTQLIEYRIKITGASVLYRARQRQKV
jgi:hypothetical protein